MVELGILFHLFIIERMYIFVRTCKQFQLTYNKQMNGWLCLGHWPKLVIKLARIATSHDYKMSMKIRFTQINLLILDKMDSVYIDWIKTTN